MRTSVVLPDAVVEEVRRVVGAGSLSEFVRESVQHRLAALRQQQLASEMEQGYRDEVEDPSLDPEWTEVETEGL